MQQRIAAAKEAAAAAAIQRSEAAAATAAAIQRSEAAHAAIQRYLNKILFILTYFLTECVSIKNTECVFY